ncbi:MAG: hypothetical protein FWF90_09415 [Promicromonosporaceae bacterium]|nr:hypothetical protein [Promicromonosporaceae bacterium]
MKVTLTQSGGFAPLPPALATVAVDSADLEPADAAHLAGLVDAAHLDTRPRVSAAPPGAADYRTSTLTVTDRRTVVVEVTELDADPAFRELVAEVKRLARTRAPKTGHEPEGGDHDVV